jgi:hypothetical protein
MAPAPAATLSPADGPYVGPRPFERRESKLFHGRTTETRILCDRILSGRLTILYGQSGLGKSSLLRTRVVPMVEDHGTRAVYFDNWSQPDPLVTLKEKLAGLAQSLGVPDAAGGSPTLTELARLIWGAGGLSLVLVLDQFEEFLVRNADRLDPLRGELAALVRSTADVAVLLSLREEYLAALEPFRQKISNLFESAYRLEELPEKDLRDAILKPPEEFGGRCEAELADRLIADLKTGSATAATEARSSFVGLPMLQLVCRELWTQASAGDKVLSLALYQRLGGAQRIIDNYVSGLMPRRARDRTLTAGLLKQLAPRSGLKNPCSVEDLTDAHSKAPAVEAELKRLSLAGILRSRRYNAGVIYELQHDAFIRVLREWRDVVLEHDRRRKKMLRAFSVLALVLTAALVSSWAAVRARQKRAAMLERQERQQADIEKAKQAASAGETRSQELQGLLEGGLLDGLKPNDPLGPSRFDVVTSYLLWDEKEKKDPRSLGKLQAMLQQHEPLLPASYGMHSPVPYDGSSQSPLKIEYSKSRHLDRAQFMWVWRDYGGYVASSSGYPVPMKVNLVETEGLSDQELAVSTAGLPPVTVGARTYDRLLTRFTAGDVKDARAKDFLEHYVTIRPFRSGFDWALIPRWSLPVWKAAQEKDHLGYEEVAIDASGLGAFQVLSDLASMEDSKQAIRKAFLSPKAVDALLRNLSHSFPTTVEEARAERGACLSDDLSSLVMNDPYALLDLPLALDRLANDRCDERAGRQAAGRAQRAGVAQQNSPAARSNQRDNRGPATPLYKPAAGGPIEADHSFDGLEDHLPGDDARFQVSGVAIAAADVDDIRTTLYRKYGVSIPVPESSREDNSQPRGVLRIALRQGIDAKAAVLSRAEERRDLWITPENTRALEDRLPQNTRDWIRKQYSVTSVKRLLQMVAARSGGTEGGIRYPTWLLASLCFWGMAEGGDAEASGMWNGDRVADDLLQTQRARARPPASETSPVRASVEAGVTQLAADRVDAALNEFSAAVRQNPAQARKAFLEMWPERLPELWIPAVRSRFDNLNKVDLDAGERIDLADLRAEGPLDTPARRELGLLRLAAGVETKRSAVLQNLLDHAAPFDQWPLSQARWLAVEFLKQWDPSQPASGSQGQFNAAVGLLQHVVEKAEAQQDAYDAFSDLIDLSQNVPGKTDHTRDIPNWSWPVLEELAALRPAGVPNMRLELAFLLASEERAERLNGALALTAAWQKALAAGDLGPAERAQQEDLITVARGRANLQLGGLGDQRALAEAETLFRKALASPWIQTERKDLAENAYATLIDALNYQGRTPAAHAVWAEARKKWPDFSQPTIGIDAAQMYGELSAGNPGEAGRIVRQAAQGAARQGTDDTWSLFSLALGSVVMQTNDWRGLAQRFLGKDQVHPYRDLFLMIYYAFDGGSKSSAASAILADRWREVSRNQGNWPARIKAGDTTAFHEMLLGRFVGTPESASLLDTVDNEERWKQFGLGELPMTHRGQQCEAWFYEAMRKKAAGDSAGMRDCLRRSVAAGVRSYVEDNVARFLLANSK